MDTAIYLFNKGNATKAAHYLEVSLFGNSWKEDVLSLDDFRNGYYKGKYEDSEPKIFNEADVEIDIDSYSASLDKLGVYFLDKKDYAVDDNKKVNALDSSQSQDDSPTSNGL